MCHGTDPPIRRDGGIDTDVLPHAGRVSHLSTAAALSRERRVAVAAGRLRAVTSSLPPSRSYEAIADRYEEERGGTRRAKEMSEAAAKWVLPGSSILDVGAGTAIVTEQLRAIGYTAIPVDISPSMLARAATRFPGGVVRADAQAIPIASGTFDAVLFAWSLHHVGDAVLALCESRRVVTPTGRIVVISGRAQRHADDIAPWFDQILALRTDRGLDPDSIVADAQSAGLELEATDLTTGSFAQSPEHLAGQIGRRLFAPLWELDDQRFAELAQPVIDGLLALPEPDRPRPRPSRHPVVILRPR